MRKKNGWPMGVPSRSQVDRVLGERCVAVVSNSLGTQVGRVMRDVRVVQSGGGGV